MPCWFCSSSCFANPPCELPSPTSDGGKISPWCVPGRQSVAIFSLHASQKWSWRGKAPLPGNISPPCIQNELALARYARHVSEKPRKPLLEDASREYLARKGPFSMHWPLESCMARESCQGPHCTGPRILPGSPHCTDPSPQIIHDVRISLGSSPSLHRSLKPCIVRRSCHPLAIFAFRWRGVLP